MATPPKQRLGVSFAGHEPAQHAQFARLEDGRVVDVKAQRLCIKYGRLWLKKVFPKGTAAERAQQDGDNIINPIHMLMLQHDGGGGQSVVHGADLERLVPGCFLLAGFPSTLADPMHPSMPKDCWYMPARNTDWSNNLDNYITIVFDKPTRVFILLSSLTSEPRWLRSKFFKLRDPNFSEVHLKVNWKIHTGGVIQYLMMGKYEAWRRSNLRVFKSKLVYQPGEQLELGGPGLADMTDLMYIVAFRHEVADGVRSSRRMSLMGGDLATQSTPGEGPSQLGGVYAAGDFLSWFQRFIKAVKRSRLNDVRFMLDSDLDRGEESSFTANNDLSYLPPSEHEVLTVDLAVNAGNLEMLCLLVHHAGCELSYKGLKMLVHHWEDVPAVFGSAYRIVLSYLLRHPGPLAVVSAVMMALRFEVQQRIKKKPTHEIEEALRLFQQMQHLLLARLQDMLRRQGADETDIMPRMEAILDPQRLGPPVVISEFRPLRVAFEDKDATFMDSPLVESYIRKVWCGKEYVLETCKDGRKILSMLDPSVAYVILLNLGLANERMQMLEKSMRLWFHTFWGSRAFFNSPRARWWMRLLGALFYIITFVQVVGASVLPSWYEHVPMFDEEGNYTHEFAHQQTVNTSIFNVAVIGNIIESLTVIALRFRSDPLRALQRQPVQAIYLAVDGLMLALSILYMLALNNVDTGISLLTFEQLTMVWAAMAPLVMARLLFVIIPLLDRLGPLLSTIQGMVMELVLFLLPWSFITAGFGIAMQVVYRNYAELDVPQFEGLQPFRDFWQTMFFLYTGFADKFDYTLFDIPDLDYSTRTYGKAILAVYTILSGILLGNLLIAIITYRYKPELVREQAALNMAEIVDTHQYQVEHGLLSSPFCVLQLLLAWLPQGRRHKVHPYYWWRKTLPFLDGFTPASPRFPTLPTGRGEFPHLLYLLTLFPCMWAVSVAGAIAHAPLCALFFALKGHKKVVAEVKALMTESFGRTSSHGSASTMAGPAASRANLAASMGPWGSQANLSLARRSSRAGTMSGAYIDSEELAALSSEGDSTTMGSRVAKLFTWRGALGAVQWVAQTVFYFVAGLLMYLGVFVVFNMVVSTIWGWAAAVAFSIYNILHGSWVEWRLVLARASQKRESGGDGSEHEGSSYEKSIPSNKVVPVDDSSKGAQACKAGEVIRQAAAASTLEHMEAQIRERRAQELSYLDPQDLRDMIYEVFGDKSGKQLGLCSSNFCGMKPSKVSLAMRERSQLGQRASQSGAGGTEGGVGVSGRLGRSGADHARRASFLGLGGSADWGQSAASANGTHSTFAQAASVVKVARLLGGGSSTGHLESLAPTSSHLPSQPSVAATGARGPSDTGALPLPGQPELPTSPKSATASTMSMAVARLSHKQPSGDHAPSVAQSYPQQTSPAQEAVVGVTAPALASLQQQLETTLASMQASLTSVTGGLTAAAQDGAVVRQELRTLKEGVASKQEVSELKAAVEALTALLMRQGGIQRLDSLISGARHPAATAAAAAAVAEVDGTSPMPPPQEPGAGQR